MGHGNYIHSVGRRYFGFIHPIMTMEYKAFGYRKEKNERETVDDGYSTTVTIDYDAGTAHGRTVHESHIVKYAWFGRHVEYATNPLFWILELLMKITSFLRVFLGKFLILGCIVMAMFGWQTNVIFNWLLYSAIGIYSATFAFPILGFIVRKAFRLDEKTDDICEENGWKKWSEVEDEI